jgi:hypothetical protein
MSKATDRKIYEIFKEFYNAVYYSKEVKSVFTINENNSELKRTAKNYFEFLYYHNPKLYYALFTPNYEGQYKAYIQYNRLDPNEYTLDNYKYDVEYGIIEDFTYSTLNTTSSDLIIADDMLYYYIDHVIARMEAYINNMKFIYMLNDTSSVLEDLLVRMINFFKSFTVDMLGLDIMYIMDFRAENAMKLFDEVAYISKDLEIHDNIKLSYKDVIHLIEAIFDNNKDNLSFHDKVLYNAYITLAKDSNGNKFNHLNLNDKIHYINSTCEVVSDPNANMLNLVDIVHVDSTVDIEEKRNIGFFKDRIAKKYYSD